MNSKGKIQAQLSAYLDGELDEAQLRQVEEALENDGALRVELAQFAATRNLLRDLPVEKPPVDLVSRILTEAERNQLVSGQHGESGSNPLRWVRYVASAAVLLMAATVGMIIAVTLCSPGTYQEALVHTPAPARGNLDGKRNTVIANSDTRRDKYGGNSRSSSGAGERFRSSGESAGQPGKSSFKYSDSAGTNNGLSILSGKGGSGAGRSGIDNNVDRIATVLAGNLTNNEIIYSDRLDDAQKQVEGILNANGIAPVATEKLEPTADLAEQAPDLPLARGNFYVANRLSSAQVQYEAYVTPEQMVKVQEELGRLRAKQNVSQHKTVLALAKADALTKDGVGNFEGGPLSKSGYHYKKGAAGGIDKVGGDGGTYGKARATTVSNGTVSAAARFPIVTGQTAAKREDDRSSTRATGSAEDEVKIALAPVALPRPVRAGTPAPAAKLAMPPGATAPEPKAPAPPTATEAPMPNESLAMKSKLGDSRRVKDDATGAAKEINGSAMAQRKTAETSPAIQAEEKSSPAVAAIDEPDLLSRRQTLGTRFGAGTYVPSTRPAGQVAGPVGGQIAAGTPNVLIAPPANQPATPKPPADADKDTKPIVQVALVDGKTMQAREKITIELDRKGQANKWFASRRTKTHGLAGAKHLAKPEQSPAYLPNAQRQIASQSARSRISQREIQQTTTRVRRLLITLNYRHVDRANKTLNQSSAKIQANPTSRATTSQIERADDKAAQQRPEQK